MLTLKVRPRPPWPAACLAWAVLWPSSHASPPKYIMSFKSFCKGPSTMRRQGSRNDCPVERNSQPFLRCVSFKAACASAMSGCPVPGLMPACPVPNSESRPSIPLACDPTAPGMPAAASSSAPATE
eukprot:4711896-Heterocapsa_arctica.AAC.2